jgi:hypothetical protein
VRRFLLLGVPLAGGLLALYLWAALSWNYATGERAGWVQKFSRKGWICKTWEGELALVTMPGGTQEKFGSFEFRVGYRACGLRLAKSSLPAIRKITVRMVRKRP